MSVTSIRCTVIKAKIYLPQGEEKPSSYASIYIGATEEGRTGTIPINNKPKWKESFLLDLFADSEITIKLFSIKEQTLDQLIGASLIKMIDIFDVRNRPHITRKRMVLKLTSNIGNNGDLVKKHKIHLAFLKLSNRNVDSSYINREEMLSGRDNIQESPPAHTEMSNIEVTQILVPPGWDRRVAENGREYYVNISTQTTQWEQPESLPPGWEARVHQPSGRIFYINVGTEQTSWDRPTSQMILDQQTNFQTQREDHRTLSRRNYNQRFLLKGKNVKITDSEMDQYEKDKKTMAEIISTLSGPFPDDIEPRTDTTTNRIYYVNHTLQTTSWEDPRLFWLKSENNPLPSSWSLRYNHIGIPFFVDHSNKTTTYIDPRTGVSIFPSAAIAITFKKQFREKLSYFQHLCRSHLKMGTVKIPISRERLFEDSFEMVMSYSPSKLHKHLYIKIEGESGLDYGGVAREWFFEVSHEIANPMYCLFNSQTPDSDYLLEINPLSSINTNHLKYFLFVGRVIGLALLNAKFLDCSFSPIFYKQILNRPCGLEDMELADNDFFRSIKWISTHNIEEEEMELYFCTEIESFGQLKVVELKPNGCDIKVTEANKTEYIKLLVEWKLNYGKQEQILSVIQGLTQIVPLTWLGSFTIKEFEMLICGMQNYDIQDWKQNTRFKGGYAPNSPQIKWFWKFIESVDAEYHGKLIFFVTGTTRIPSTGFKDLIGSSGPQKFCIEKWGSPNDLPRSHTCFNRLDLPPYNTYEELREKIIFAIEEGRGFYEE